MRGFFLKRYQGLETAEETTEVLGSSFVTGDGFAGVGKCAIKETEFAASRGGNIDGGAVTLRVNFFNGAAGDDDVIDFAEVGGGDVTAFLGIAFQVSPNALGAFGGEFFSGEGAFVVGDEGIAAFEVLAGSDSIFILAFELPFNFDLDNLFAGDVGGGHFFFFIAAKEATAESACAADQSKFFHLFFL